MILKIYKVGIEIKKGHSLRMPFSLSQSIKLI